MAGARSTTSLPRLTPDPIPPYESLLLEVILAIYRIVTIYRVLCAFVFADMGCGEIDGSYREQLYNPSLNTTDRLMEELYRTDFLMHIGDMSYAQGYAAIVCTVHLTGQILLLVHFSLLCSGTHSLTSWGTSLPPSPTWCALETMRETHRTQCE